MATLQGKAVKNTYRQVLQIGANNVGVSGSLQPVQDGAGVNTALSLSTGAATINGNLTITGDLIITGGGIEIKELIDDTVAALITNGTGITWTYNDGANTLTGNFTGTTSVVPEGSNLYYTQGRFDSAFAAKSTTNLAEGTNLYFTEARGNANFATNLAASDTDDLSEGSTNLYYTNTRARTALSVTAGTGLSYDNTTGVFNLAAIPNASLTNSSITINGQAVSLGGTVTLTTTNIAEGTNLYWTEARGNSNFTTNLAASSTTNLAEGTNLYYTQARFDTAFSNKSTTNLAEGTNLYYTQARFNSALAAKTTTDLAEGTNLYYTDARARLALSSSATGLSYANNSGVFSLTAGYAIPTTVKLGEYDIAYNRSIVSAAVTGTSTKTLSLTQQDANVITATWTDQGITTINGTANQIAATTVGNTTTLAFTNDVTMPNNLVVSGNLTINGTATYVNTESISSKDPLFEVANTNNTTDAVDIGYYGRYYDAIQERVEFTGLFRDASDAGKFKIFSGLVDEPTNVVNTTGTGYTVATLVANVDGNLAGTANAANILSTARTIAASGDAAWSVSFDGSANVTSALTLANTGVTATTYGTSTAVPTIAVDSKGRITSASNTNITFPVTTVNGFAGTVVLTTSDVAEGTNQYFTTARAQASITGGASSVVTANLTASRALVSDGSGKIAASATTTTTEIGYLAGVTSAIQTQLDSKLNLTGGTLTGPLIGTTGSFSSSGSGDTFTIGHTSGSGIALNITKNGNGEGLYINKASGSGNAATIVGNLGGTTASFSGLLSGTSATFSSTLSVTGALSGTSATFSGNLAIAGQTLSAWGGTFGVMQSYYGSYFGGTSGGGTVMGNNNYFDGTNYKYINTDFAGQIQIGGGNILLRVAPSGTAGNNVTYTNALTISSTGAATFSSTLQSNDLTIKNSTNAETLDLFLSPSTSNGFIDYPSGRSLTIRNKGSLGNLTLASTGAATFSSSVTAGGGSAITINSSDIYTPGANSEDDLLVNRFGYNGGTTQNRNFRVYDGKGNTIFRTFGSNLITQFFGNIIVEKVTPGLVLNGTPFGSSGAYINLQGWASGNKNWQLAVGTTGGAGLELITSTTAGGTSFGTVVGRFADATGIYTPVSDVNKKKDFEVSTIGLKEVLQLKPTLYRMKSEDESAPKELGFIAQEVKEFIPQAYVESGDEDNKFIGLNFNAITAGNTKAIQELYELVINQQAVIEELKALIAAK
jgi:hypothetical protein